MEKEEFDIFFKSYAENVDSVDKNSFFWKLSDKIILEIIKKEILRFSDNSSIIFDAGGGSGRWVVKMSRESDANFIIYDMSTDMLKKAEENISKFQLEDRVKILKGDMCNIENILDNSVDFITSIYSPISFIYDKGTAFKEMYRILKPGGKIIVMGHGFYNSIYSKINNYNAPAEELKSLFKDGLIKWAPHVPKLITFSKENMEKSLSDVGFVLDKSFGVPVFVQPGLEDFNPDNDGVSKISKYLSEEDNFNAIFEMEMESNSISTLVNRGMNIFSLAQK